MSVEIASRELRNNTAAVLRKVGAGERVVITTRGKPVASLTRYSEPSKRWIDRAELARRLRRASADHGLRADLRRLAGDTTDDLDPLP